ncbi:hypothetical protein JCM5296_005848 [Sporobolomyces johnsonii]
MSSRSSSPASTVRATTPSAPSHPDLLISALSRLNLTPAPSPPRRVQPIVSEPSSAASFHTLCSVTTHDDPDIWTLGSTSGDDGGSRSGLMSRDEASSYAHEVALAFVQNPSHVSGGSSARKLVFYQSLIVQFALRTHAELPTSIKKCKKLLKARLHISIKQYLEVMRRGGNVLTEVKQFRSKAALCSHLRKPRTRVRIDEAKAEMLEPLLITISYH